MHTVNLINLFMQSQVKVLHKAIKDDPEEDVVTFLDNAVDYHMLIRTKDKVCAAYPCQSGDAT